MSESKFSINQVVQFIETHKWCGSLGIITEIKDCGDDYRYLIGIPVPQQGTVFIFSMESDNDFEYVGNAVLTVANDDGENDEEE